MYERIDGSKKPRLLVADSHPATIEGICAILEDDFEVVGTVTDGRNLLDLASQLHPDAVVLDVQLPSLNGFEATRNLQNLDRTIKILIYSFHDGAGYLGEAISAGASGYVLKTSANSELIKGLQQILRGNTYLQGSAQQLHKSDHARRGTSKLFRELTPRQREVLQLVCEGKSAKMIAAILNISSKTVEFHKAAMMDALQVSTSAELIRYAVERGMFGPPAAKLLPASASI